MADRVTYRGVKLFANDNLVSRITAFGSSSSLNMEEIRELGNSGLVDIYDDVPSVDISIDSYQWGNMSTLLWMAGKSYIEESTLIGGNQVTPIANNWVDFSSDFDKSDAYVDFISIVETSDGDDRWLQYIGNAFLTSVSFSFPVDGDFTESYSLTGDNKKWLVNTTTTWQVFDSVTVSTAGEISVTCTASSSPTRVISLKHAGSVLTDEINVTVTGDIVKIEYEGFKKDDIVTDIRIAADSGVLKSSSVTNHPSKSLSVLRRGRAEVYLVIQEDDVVTVEDGFKGKILYATNDLYRVDRLQNVSIEVSLDREELRQLGSNLPYARPLTLPISVSTSFESTLSDLSLYAKLTGKTIGETPTEMMLSDFLKKVGLVVRVYSDDDKKLILKEFHIPRLIPADESFNTSLDANATQNFSFNAHELWVGDMVELASYPA